MKTFNLFGILCLSMLFIMNSCTEESSEIYNPQNSVEDQLKSHLSNFKVVELNAQQIVQNLQNQPGDVKTLELIPGEVEYEVSATQYLPEMMALDENDHHLTDITNDLIIYDNLKLNRTNGAFHIIIEGDELEAEFTKNDSNYSIQPVSDFVSNAPANQYVMYKNEDVLDQSIPEGALMEMEEENNMINESNEDDKLTSGPGAKVNTVYGAQVNSFLFHRFTQQIGSRRKAFNYISRIYYKANFKYMNRSIPFFLSQGKVRFIRIGRFGIDYTNDVGEQKVIFRNALNNAPHLKNDLNILWTSKFVSFPGSAYVKRICQRPDGRGRNVAVLKAIPDPLYRHYRTNFAIHEITHQIGGRHLSVPRDGNYIFRPKNVPSQFSEMNIRRINNTFASDSLNLTCLDPYQL